ncbi:MAG: aminotransferase class I/II-fold pyridoxal phosphate-dependent enzyme [Spirochaetota bacterium]
MDTMRPFQLERFFSKYEFSAKHLLCASDCESMSVRELLAFDAGREAGGAEGLLDLRLGYTETRGSPALRRDIAALYAEGSRGGPGPEGIFVHAGAEEAVLNFCLATINPGDRVIVNEPAYQSLSELPRWRGAELDSWRVREDGSRWFLDPDELGRLLSKKTKAVIINLPHNPTGALATRGEFEAIVSHCRKAGVILFVDEVYRHLELKESRRLPPACEAYENGVSLNVLSKSAGLAGLRLGWLATRRADILEAVAVVKDYNSICASAPSEYLAGIAVRNFEAITAKNRRLCADNLALLEAFVARHPDFISWVPPEASSIGFPRLAGRAELDFASDAEAMALRLLEDRGVLLLPGAYYGYDRRHFRIGYGRASMVEALVRLERWVEKLGY